MVNITIAREQQTFITDPAIEVLVDEVKVGEVKNGESLPNIQVTEGQHCVSFNCSVRHAEVNGNFINDAVIAVRFNKASGEIEATLQGAEQVEPVQDWKDQPRDPNMVYPDKRKTSPIVAAVLSVLLVGLGQMLNGQVIKGILMLISAMIIGAITGGVVAVLIWIVSAIDAYMSCNKLMQGKPIGRFSFF